MSVLARFSTPAGLAEPSDADAEAWSARVGAIVAAYADEFEQFYDPTVDDTPAEAQRAPVVWAAFPARLLREATSEAERWQRADGSRHEQDEYCEWTVERDASGTVTRVTFTSEVREYFEHVAERDPGRLLTLYRELVAPDVELDELLDGSAYDPGNPRNATTGSRPAHLIQRNNNLGAAIDLAAKATILREEDGEPVTSKQRLVSCAGLGDPFRNSDPQIAAAVNEAAATGAEITLADPAGLYIDGLITAGFETPDGTDPAAFWTIERGTAAHTLRARYEVPADAGYAVGDITIGGREIRYGAQLADAVRVRLDAIVKPAAHRPVRRPCEG